LDTVFNSTETDFFPFVRLTLGDEPSTLSDEDADEYYEFYLEVLEYREKQRNSAKRTRRSKKQQKKHSRKEGRAC
jgi:hypothetical protein